MARAPAIYAYTLVAVFKDGSEELLTTTIYSRRQRVIDHAKAHFYGGGYSWPYIKRRGWRVQKIRISAVDP